MMQSGKFRDQKILLLDKAPKDKNDRTWCFWEEHPGFFESIVFSKWEQIAFVSEEYANNFTITPYQYKMIRGIDFYEYCLTEIERHKNVEFVYANYNQHSFLEDNLILTLNNIDYTLQGKDTQIFNSIYKPTQQNKKTIRLLQHFKGWVVETEKPEFNPAIATIMDFRVEQKQGTSFVYVLPLSVNKALIEYTQFTESLLPAEQYDIELENYIQHFLGITNYTISEKEFGVIPMTNEKLLFSSKIGWNIGTAGGQTKGSSGYTFQFIQKQSDKILALLLNGKPLADLPETASRFRFYDNTLLHILYHRKLSGKKIFTTLFKKNNPTQVLKFLDNETTFAEELKLISTLPTWPFLKAALNH